MKPSTDGYENMKKLKNILSRAPLLAVVICSAQASFSGMATRKTRANPNDFLKKKSIDDII